ncbi:protein FAR-RED IMPAIRED RESPONSE 1-like [Arachis duranensis]|uniref:Protein FAR-RED IMPAIRED RESPONSE 1-like n=1 Tax=Arachis duranensis TaxID=130453 RepID=A0A6P4DKZ4_ARADU|nr:protein FAR-RED IMPAIRED RESPONSE 1-like [Arachis duranensis]
MSEADIMQMINMLKSGIITSQIFGLLASQAGGYEFVSYGLRDMYNEITRQRRQVPGDAARVLKKLEDMRLKDPQLYFKTCHDSRGLLRNLFWSDRISQLDYQLFEDIIAFDATYKKNKYSCPLVIFSEVNHHNQTIVFAAALIMDETTDTYIWLLRQLMFAMKGKTPTSIITDGAMEIKNVVQLLEEFGLEDKPCVNNMYEEKHMWATAYIRGKFFADFRTTSRCEGLHSVVAMYVRSRVGSMRVLNIENNDDCIKYIVCKHGRPDFMWTVEFCQEEMIFMCTCLRMESFGIPCEHIVKVLDEREICEIFWSLVLNRWTKKVKSALNDASGFTRDAVVISHQSALMEFSKQLVVVATKVPKRYEETRDIIMGLYSSYKAADEGTNQPQSSVAKSSNLYMHQTNIGSGQPSKKKRQRCNVCQMEGHKKTACPWEKDIDNNVIEDEANGSDDGDMYTEPTADLDSDN